MIRSLSIENGVVSVPGAGGVENITLFEKDKGFADSLNRRRAIQTLGYVSMAYDAVKLFDGPPVSQFFNNNYIPV